MKRGSRVVKRGIGAVGTVLDEKDGWVSVRWDDGPAYKERPKLCVAAELEELPA